jgi:hypothetical protein
MERRFVDQLPWRAKIAPTLRYAYFSPAAAEEFGSVIYLAHDGSEVEVTCVGESLTDCGIYNNWLDRYSVKPVTHFLRTGRKGHGPTLHRYHR